jgi:hypothetical protein
VRAAALALVALAMALSGCETTAEKSAKLERQALRAASHIRAASGLSVGRASRVVQVVDSAVLHSSEGTAVAVTLRNLSAQAVGGIPIAVTVHASQGSAAYSNAIPGLAHSLTTAPLIEAHGELTWVDDQVSLTGTASGASAKVGEGETVRGASPRLTLEGTSLFEEPGSGFAEKGTVVNHSSVAQHELVVYATARRSAKIVAAGRAVIAQVPAGGTAPFQLFFIGNPQGAQLELSVPPSTLR